MLSFTIFKKTPHLMKHISIELSYESTNEQILEATRKLVYSIFSDYLGREPTAEDRLKFTDRINPENASINDMYFEGKKYGSLATTYILDSAKGIKYDFIPEN